MKTIIVIPTEIYSRVAGYFRPLNQWNKGKKSEFKDRKTYDLGNSITTIAKHNKPSKET
jgi:ribonucleoside-triphosphate reductase